MLHSLAFELNSNHAFVLGIVAIGATIPIVGMIVGAARNTAVNKEREQSRRELAAYVAEGSITADEAERILKAGPARRAAGSCCSTTSQNA